MILFFRDDMGLAGKLDIFAKCSLSSQFVQFIEACCAVRGRLMRAKLAQNNLFRKQNSARIDSNATHKAN